LALNADCVGKVYGPTEPYEVSRVKIAEFADATGEPSALCRDAGAAKAAGYPDVIAPPTFAIVISMKAADEAWADPELGLDFSMIVHGDQGFTHSRPLHAGDMIVATTTIESIKATGSMSMLVTATDLSTAEGEHVCTARSTIVERGK